MVKEEKLKAVEELRNEIERYPIIGIIDMFKLPSRQLQQIKKKVKGQAEIKVMKKSILEFAMKGVKKKGMDEVMRIMPKQTALILTSIDPFKFYLMVDRLKSPAAAKAGDIAPNDILVSAGPTNLLPGPAISELTKVGIPAGVEEGKIAVKKDTVVAKKGDKISAALSNALKKLNIEPVLVGLNIVAVYQNGMIYSKDVLCLVGDAYINKLKEAYTQSLNLSVAICYPTKENIGHLLSKAQIQAQALESKFGGVK